MKKWLIIFICCLLIFSLVGCKGKQAEFDPREREFLQALDGVNNNYDAAIKKAKELYDGEELDKILKWLDEDKKSWDEHNRQMGRMLEDSLEMIEIQPGHTHEIGDNYVYIRGRVKNVSDFNIKYFEVVVDFLDNNDQVLNSDYTNDGLVLKPGDMREFEIMSRWNDEYESYCLYIGDVK